MRFNIVGTGRCGSTLLGQMLDLHPDVFVFTESHWIPKMYEFFGAAPGEVEDLLGIVLRTTHVTGDRVLTCSERALRDIFRDAGPMSVAAFCDRMGTSFAARAGKRHWADKTPDYGPYMSMLQSIWPSCRFIHVIRHGADAALSMSKHPGYRWLAGTGETWWVPASFNGYHRAARPKRVPFSAFAALWERRLRRIRDEASRLPAGSFLEVRFEDLLDRPPEILATVARFAGLDVPQEWLAEAGALVNRRRVTSRSTRASIEDMGAGPCQLLAELGYASGAAGS